MATSATSTVLQHLSDGTYCPLGKRLEIILRMRAEGDSWAEIGARVELDWQTCEHLARTHYVVSRAEWERAFNRLPQS